MYYNNCEIDLYFPYLSLMSQLRTVATEGFGTVCILVPSAETCSVSFWDGWEC